MRRRLLCLNKINSCPRLLQQIRPSRLSSQLFPGVLTSRPTITHHTKPKPSKVPIHLLILNPNNRNTQLQLLSNLCRNTLQTHTLLSNSMIHPSDPSLCHSKTKQSRRIIAMTSTPITINTLHIRRLALLQRNANQRRHGPRTTIPRIRHRR